MEIIRMKNPETVKLLQHNLIVERGVTKNEAIEEIETMMRVTPDKILILVIIDNNKIVGQTIAWLPYGRNFVWVDQAWCEIDTPEEVKKNCFNKLKDWASGEIGVSELRCETIRCPAGLVKKWGFEKHSEVLRCSI